MVETCARLIVASAACLVCCSGSSCMTISTELPVTPEEAAATISGLPQAKPWKPPASLPDALQEAARGEAVLAVRYVPLGQRSVPDQPFPSGGPLLDRLQTISDIYSTADLNLIPFRVRDTYVIAPEQQEVLNPDIKAASPLDLAHPGVLMEIVLVNLTREQIRKLGSEEGLAASDLPKPSSQLLERAFAPPLELARWGKRPGGADGKALFDVRRVERRFDEPMDWSKVHLRARLELETPRVDLDGRSTPRSRREGRCSRRMMSGLPSWTARCPISPPPRRRSC